MNNEDIFDRIKAKAEAQLSPDRAVTERILSIAASRSEDGSPSETEGVTDMDNNREIKTGGRAAVRPRYGLIAAAAVFAVAAAGTGLFLRRNVSHKTEKPLVTAAAGDESGAVTTVLTGTEDSGLSAVTEAPKVTETAPETTPVVTSEPNTPPEEINDPMAEVNETDNGKADWYPDPEEDIYENPYADDRVYDNEGNVLDIARIEDLPIDSHPEFVFEGRTYSCVNEYFGTAGAFIDYSTGTRNIPNESYIDSLLGRVTIPSADYNVAGDLEAEVYSLMYTDSSYIAAVRFSNDPRFFLYADKSRQYETLSEFLNAVDLDKCCFGGGVFMRDNYYNFREIEDETEFVATLMTLDGTITAIDTDENVFECFPASPLYGSAISFRFYPDGHAVVNAFGTLTAYDTGEDIFKMIALLPLYD